MKFILGSFTFGTKGEAVKSVQHVLHNAPVGELLAGRDLELVLALLDRHPHREDKLAGGMAGIAVLMNNEGYLARGFHVMRPDGSTKDFSYRVAIDGKTKGPTIQEACRQAVWRDIVAYRNARLAEGTQCCDVSGEPLTPLKHTRRPCRGAAVPPDRQGIRRMGGAGRALAAAGRERDLHR